MRRCWAWGMAGAALVAAAQPTGLTAVRETATSVTISWASSEAGIAGFEVQRAPDNGQGQAGNPEFIKRYTDGYTATLLTDNGLIKDALYFYRVRGFRTGFAGAEPSTLVTDWTSFLQTKTKAAVVEPRIEGSVLAPGRASVAKISYDVLSTGRVEVRIYTFDGVKVKTVFEGDRTQGQLYTDQWDGTNDDGDPVASGTYLVHVKSSDQSSIRKVVVAR